jgi:hypothetical protein
MCVYNSTSAANKNCCCCCLNKKLLSASKLTHENEHALCRLSTEGALDLTSTDRSMYMETPDRFVPLLAKCTAAPYTQCAMVKPWR